MKLSARLKTIADMIPNDSSIIDVGCDHGLLAIYLSLVKNCRSLATDINAKALEGANKNIIRYKAKNVETKLTDGLDDIVIKPDDYIIIAGMGTKTIIHILKNKKLSDNLIIASQNHLSELRKFMFDLGYRIDNELFIEDRAKKYIVIHFKKGKQKYTKYDILFGPIVFHNREYLQFELSKLEKIKENLPGHHLISHLKLNRYINYLKRELKRTNYDN